MGQTETIPLFPLGTVLFPGGKLPLRIFEPRYLSMIGRCREENAPFGVVLIREGQDARWTDADIAPTIWPFGTGAEVLECVEGPDGTLGLLAGGTSRFAVRETWEADDHLMLGKVEWIEPEPRQALAPEHSDLIPVIEQLREQPALQQAGVELNADDAVNLAWRLTEMLPVDPADRQSVLQMNQVSERLDWVLMKLANAGRGPRGIA